MTDRIPSRKWFLIFGSVLLAALLITAVSMSSTRSAQSRQFLIDNKTRGFAVEQAQPDGDLVRLALRNQYDKNIKAYTVAIGNVKMEEDFIYSDRVIAPQELFLLELPNSRRLGSTEPLRISVLAVVFEDTTSDGLIDRSLATKERRLGAKLQFERIIHILRTLIASDDDDASKLARLKTRAASLPKDESASRAFNSGLHGGKERLLQIVKRLEQSYDSGERGNFKRELVELLQEFENMVSKVID